MYFVAKKLPLAILKHTLEKKKSELAQTILKEMEMKLVSIEFLIG